MSLIKFIIKWFIIFYLLYAGLITVLPWVKNGIFKSTFTTLTTNKSNMSDEQIVSLIVQEADKMGITISNDNISIENSEAGKEFKLNYSVTVNYPFIMKHKVLTFEIKKTQYR